MVKTSAAPDWQRALLILTGTVVGLVVVSCLYWAQTVFIPVALAVFLTFLPAPLVAALQRRGLKRLFSVILVVLMAASVLGGSVWGVTAELRAWPAKCRSTRRTSSSKSSRCGIWAKGRSPVAWKR